LQISHNIYCERNIIATNECGGVRRVVKGGRRKITVLAFVCGTEVNHNTLRKAKERAVEIQTTYFLNTNYLNILIPYISCTIFYTILLCSNCRVLRCVHSLTYYKN